MDSAAPTELRKLNKSGYSCPMLLKRDLFHTQVSGPVTVAVFRTTIKQTHCDKNNVQFGNVFSLYNSRNAPMTLAAET